MTPTGCTDNKPPSELEPQSGTLNGIKKLIFITHCNPQTISMENHFKKTCHWLKNE